MEGADLTPREHSKYILAIYTGQFIQAPCSQLKEMLHYSVCRRYKRSFCGEFFSLKGDASGRSEDLDSFGRPDPVCGIANEG